MLLLAQMEYVVEDPDYLPPENLQDLVSSDDEEEDLRSFLQPEGNAGLQVT